MRPCRSDRGGFSTLAACHRSHWLSRPAVTCRSKSGKNSRYCGARQVGVREIAGRVGRDPGTISRELRRNAVTRDGKLEYRALVAQWKAQQAAKRPKRAWRPTTGCASTSRNAFLSWANSGVTAGGQAKTDARDACVIAETLRHRGDLGEVEGRHLARDRAAAAGDPSHRPGGPNQRARRHWLPPSTPSESASPRRWSSSDGSAGP